jgi:hydrogenase-4 transcriptional activator
LRERICDIPALVQHFVELKAKELKLGYTPRLAPGSIERLTEYPWPGNVRELANVVERAMILCRDGWLRFDLYSNIQQSTGPIGLDQHTESYPPLDVMVREHIRRALDLTKGKIHGAGGAGELLGVNPNTLRNRMRKLGIPFKHMTK